MNKTDDLRTEVANLIAEVERTHRYSMSRIYNLYNQAYGTEELPQSCSSCLIRKVRRLKEWLSEQSVDDQDMQLAVKVVKKRSKQLK